MADRHFVFTVTTGRSGTVYLTELLKANMPKAEVHHERVGWLNFGVETPDASHFMLYNSVGNVPEVEAFWEQKLKRLGHSQVPQYVETSHFLSKGGLIENLHHLTDYGTVHIINLKREPHKIAWSLFNRKDFANWGFTWLFYLDPRYPNKIVRSDPFMSSGELGGALWYVHEMQARGAYYKLLLQDMPNVVFHDIDLSDITDEDGAHYMLTALGCPPDGKVVIPPKQNETQRWREGEANHRLLMDLVDRLPVDAEKRAKAYFDMGYRLGAPDNEFVPFYHDKKKRLAEELAALGVK